MEESKIYKRVLMLFIFILTTISIHIGIKLLGKESVNVLGILLSGFFGFVLWLFYVFTNKI